MHLDAAFELTTEDVTWWVPGAGDFDRAAFRKLTEAAFEQWDPADFVMDVVGVTAEGDRVAIEAHGRVPLKNGGVYDNTYHFLFVFENGKIKQAKEYNDSKAASETLGLI